MKNNNKLGYHIFHPFVDAYVNTFFGINRTTLKDIENIMKMRSIEYGSRAIGNAVLYGHDIPKYEDGIVLCCAYIYEDNEQYTNTYLAVVDNMGENWEENIKIVQGSILKGWDIT